MLLGNALPGDDWTVLLSERFERRGAYVVPRGSVDWDSLGPSYVPAGRARVPSRRLGSRGRALRPDARPAGPPARDHLGGRAGQRPAADATTSSTCSSRSSTTRRSRSRRVREAAHSARHQRALEELLAVSSRITGEASHAEILRRVCTGIRDALDFSNVCAALVDPATGAVVPHATAGWQPRGAAAARARHRRPDRAAARRDVPARGLLPPHPRRERGAARGRGRGLPVAAQRARALGVEPAHADRAPCRTASERAARDHLGRQPERPARALGRPPTGAADLRERRRSRARLGQASRRAALPRRPRPAHAAAQPSRLREPSRGRGRAGACATAAPSASWSPTSTTSSNSTTATGMPPATRALVAFASVLAESLRKPDDAFRIGGDEFAVLLAEATDEDARQVVARVRTGSTGLRATGSRGSPTSARASAAPRAPRTRTTRRRCSASPTRRSTTRSGTAPFSASSPARTRARASLPRPCRRSS